MSKKITVEDKLEVLSKQIATLNHRITGQRQIVHRERLHRLATAAPSVAAIAFAAAPSEDKITSAVIACLRSNHIAENAGPDDSITENFKEAETADAATGNPHLRIIAFLHCLEDRLGWDPGIAPTQLLDGDFSTPSEIANAALFNHP